MVLGADFVAVRVTFLGILGSFQVGVWRYVVPGRSCVSWRFHGEVLGIFGVFWGLVREGDVVAVGVGQQGWWLMVASNSFGGEDNEM